MILTPIITFNFANPSYYPAKPGMSSIVFD